MECLVCIQTPTTKMHPNSKCLGCIQELEVHPVFQIVYFIYRVNIYLIIRSYIFLLSGKSRILYLLNSYTLIDITFTYITIYIFKLFRDFFLFPNKWLLQLLLLTMSKNSLTTSRKTEP